jgi:hypothetical protein
VIDARGPSAAARKASIGYAPSGSSPASART